MTNLQHSETTTNNPYLFRQFDVTKNSTDYAKLDRTIQNAKKNEDQHRTYNRIKMTDIPQERIVEALKTEKSISYVIEKKKEDEPNPTSPSDSKTEQDDLSVFVGFCLAIKKVTKRRTDIHKVRIYSIDVIPEYDSQFLSISKLLLSEMINYIMTNCKEIIEVNICASDPELTEYLESLGFFKFEHLFRYYPNGDSCFKMKLLIPREKTTPKT